MIRRLTDWGERRGADVARRKARAIAGRLRETVRGASIEIEEASVIIRGRGLVKRWLIDPELRFLVRDRG